jgi:hypothetical protein
MPTSPKFGLRHLFSVTALVALLAFGIALVNEDAQTGMMISLFATALVLASLFLGILREVWAGVAVGFVLSAICYWLRDSSSRVHPADRLFEFVMYTIWFSVIGIGIAIIARAIRAK